MKHSSFCYVHGHKCRRIAPLNGYEPKYEPSFWNEQYPLKETHNCFAYAFNVNDKSQIKKCKEKNCNVPFHQPGMASGYTKFKSSKPKTCPNMMARLIGDNPNLTMSRFEEKCPAGSSKIALIIDENEDYHFLRQDSNGYWFRRSARGQLTMIFRIQKVQRFWKDFAFMTTCQWYARMCVGQSARNGCLEHTVGLLHG